MVNLAPVVGGTGTREDDLYRAVRDTVASDYDLLGELGRGERGSVVYLARELATGHLVALRLDRGAGGDADYELTVVPTLDDSIPAPGTSCPYCGREIHGWARFCPQCGRDISGEAGTADATAGFTAEELLAAVRDSAADDYEVLGEMSRARGGGRVYFARDLATGAIVALRLQRERSSTGEHQFSLGRTQVLKPLVADMGAQYASPTVVASPMVPPPAVAPPSPNAPPVATRSAPDRGPASVPATPPASPPPPPRPPAPEGRTVVGLPAAIPGAPAPIDAVVADASVGDGAVVDAPPSRGTRRRNIMIGAGVGIALLGALALTMAGDDDALDFADTVAAVDTTAVAKQPPPPPVDTSVSSPPVDTPAAPAVRRTVLLVTGELPPGATISVDGRQLRGRQTTVAAGFHTLVARATGYDPFSQRIEIAGDTARWSPRLRRRPEPPRDSIASAPVDPQPKTEPGPTCARAVSAQDWGTARTLCRREAGTGDAAAQRQLGVLLLSGRGGPVDEAGAVNWLRTAADADDPQAMYELGRVYQSRRAYRNDGRAYDLFRRAALRGHQEAQLQAGRALEHGIGTRQNLREAFLMYEQAAKSGYAAAQNAYGVFLKKGLGTRRDDRKALEWLTKAAQGGSPDAHFHIGELHEEGRAGLPKSRAAALEWYRKGAALGSEEARRALRR